MTLPGYEAQRAVEMQWAFSNNKQSDYDTAVVDGDLTFTHPVREANVAEVNKEFRSDREHYGKGHEFATDIWEVARDVRYSRTVDGSSYILGWLCAYAFGKVATTQPDATNCPNTYNHEMVFFDPDTETTAQIPTTTVVEKVTGAANYKRKLLSMALNTLTISAEGFEHLSATAEFIGKGETPVSTLSMPALPTVEYLTSNYAVIELGDASEVLTTRVRSWSVTINNDLKEARGYFPSSGLYRGRMEIGNRSIVPALVLDLDATDDLHADFLADTQLSLKIVCEGALAEGGACTTKHKFEIEFPRLYYTAVPIEENDGILTYAVTFSEESVLYATGDTPAPLVQVNIINLVDDYLVSSV